MGSAYDVEVQKGLRELHGAVRGGAAGGEEKAVPQRAMGMEWAAQDSGHSLECHSQGLGLGAAEWSWG